MKQNEILPIALSGHPVCVGEFRDWAVKEPKSGTVISTTHVLMGREMVEVQRFEPKNVRLLDVKRPNYKVGDKLVFVGHIETSRFGTRGKGELSPLES